MKAELFVHATSQDLVGTLRGLIAEEVDALLPVEVSSVDVGTVDQNVSIGRRYSQLLQAAIPPELGITLSVSSLAWLGERTYLQVYWPVAYPSYQRSVASYFPGDFSSFFPAIAIRDRMVVVPIGQGKVLATVDGEPRVDTALRPDVLEVDFRNENAVRSALRTVAEGLSAQLQQELTAWASFQPPGSFDVTAAARDLDIDIDMLRRRLADRIAAVQLPYRRVTCALDINWMPVGRWTRVRLTVTNGSDTALDSAALTIAGPVEVLPARHELDLPAGASTEIALAIKPVDEGEFPIEITIVRSQDLPFNKWLPPVALWLESVGAGG